MRITGDSEDGKKELDYFIDPESNYPVIATTSQLMTTGVDSQTCKLIVLDKNISSVSEFKQIIGRGTRVREDYGKFYFTIMDFRGITELFADPTFDGEPVVIYEPKGSEPVAPPDDSGDIGPNDGSDIVDYGPLDTGVGIIHGRGPQQKYFVNNVLVKVINERVQYIGEDGKLITESLKGYTKKNILNEYRSLDEFLNAWSSVEKKEAIIEELEKQGVLFDALKEESGKDLDPFDLVCHIAFGKKPLTRKERAESVRKRDYFSKYEGKAREVINALLDKYADNGITAIDDIGDLLVKPFTEFGTPYEIVNDIFGGRDNYLGVVKKIEQSLYAV